MGKTIQMISLLLAEPGKPNLIVAPTVAIVQWRNEIQEHAPSLKVLIFHGSNRTESMSELMKQDVVLTTCKSPRLLLLPFLDVMGMVWLV